MTPFSPAEARARCEAATPGPWEMHAYGDGQASVQMPRGRSFVFGTVYGAPGIAAPYDPKKPIHGVTGPDLDGLTEEEYARQRYADGDFIAAARTDLPLALAALEASERRVGELEGALGTADGVLAEMDGALLRAKDALNAGDLVAVDRALGDAWISQNALAHRDAARKRPPALSARVTG